jgi:hypothetical protein
MPDYQTHRAYRGSLAVRMMVRVRVRVPARAVEMI